VTEILASERGSAAPAICSDCEIILCPIFNDNHSKTNDDNQFPSTTPQELADAIVEIVDARVRKSLILLLDCLPLL
jgi:hypothetical protein